jgi:guanylate kinase
VRGGRIVIVSGPAGVGKTTICDQLLKRPNFVRSISATTRIARHGERDNIDYQFWNKVAFEKAAQEGYFLEWARVHENLYGTPRGPVEEKLRQGKNVILNIDVQGAAQLRRLGLPVISFFLMPPTPEVLRERLAGRKSDSVEEVERRLKVAQGEMARASEYDHVIYNRDIGTTVSEIEAILEQSETNSDGVET